MIAVKDKIWSLRQGLFAKYVFALVGLVVFVLAVNGAMETWISYRATRTTLTDAMGEKAEATARRIEQSVSELERQISWVTRASAVTLAQHNADYAQLLNQVPQVEQLTLLDGAGREQLKLSRTAVQVGSKADFSRDFQLHRNRRPRRQLCAGRIPRRAALHVDRGVAFRLQCRRHRRRYRSCFPLGLSRRRPGRQGRLCLCGRSARPRAGEFGQGTRNWQGARQAAAGRSPDQGQRRAGVGHRQRWTRGADGGERGAKTRLVRAVRAADRAGAWRRSATSWCGSRF